MHQPWSRSGARRDASRRTPTRRGTPTRSRLVLEDIGDPPRVKLGKAQAPVRVAVTGRSVGPPLFESLEVLGRDGTIDVSMPPSGRLSRTGLTSPASTSGPITARARSRRHARSGSSGRSRTARSPASTTSSTSTAAAGRLGRVAGPTSACGVAGDRRRPAAAARRRRSCYYGVTFFQVWPTGAQRPGARRRRDRGDGRGPVRRPAVAAARRPPRPRRRAVRRRPRRRTWWSPAASSPPTASPRPRRRPPTSTSAGVPAVAILMENERAHDVPVDGGRRRPARGRRAAHGADRHRPVPLAAVAADRPGTSGSEAYVSPTPSSVVGRGGKNCAAQLGSRPAGVAVGTAHRFRPHGPDRWRGADSTHRPLHGEWCNRQHSRFWFCY